MINFRFHLISLIAVFLALAIGVVMGSAVIDRVIVDGLRSRIDTVERNADARRDENDRLKADAARTGDYIDATAPYAVTNRLTGVPAVVLAWRGTDDSVVRNQIALMATAGAKAAGVLWLEGTWDLADTRAADLAAAIGITGTDPDALRKEAVARIAARLSGAGPGDVVEKLVDAGFVTFEPIGDTAAAATPAQYAPPGASVEVIIGSSAVPAATATFPILVKGLADARVPTVVAESYKEAGKKGPARGALIAPVRDDAQIAPRVSTVDNVDTVQGRVAAVLALAAAPSGRIGKYGVGPGTRPVPEWTQP
ncbi:MAG: copper transporter [Acidimicrobiia bacterium]